MEKHITVTEAARNFADCVNRARYQNVTFVLLKAGVPVARLIPEQQKSCTGRDLAATLATVQLTEREAERWRSDLRSARRHLKPLKDKWR